MPKKNKNQTPSPESEKDPAVVSPPQEPVSSFSYGKQLPSLDVSLENTPQKAEDPSHLTVMSKRSAKLEEESPAKSGPDIGVSDLLGGIESGGKDIDSKGSRASDDESSRSDDNESKKSRDDKKEEIEEVGNQILMIVYDPKDSSVPISYNPEYVPDNDRMVLKYFALNDSTGVEIEYNENNKKLYRDESYLVQKYGEDNLTRIYSPAEKSKIIADGVISGVSNKIIERVTFEVLGDIEREYSAIKDQPDHSDQKAFLQNQFTRIESTLSDNGKQRLKDSLLVQAEGLSGKDDVTEVEFPVSDKNYFSDLITLIEDKRKGKFKDVLEKCIETSKKHIKEDKSIGEAVKEERLSRVEQIYSQGFNESRIKDHLNSLYSKLEKSDTRTIIATYNNLKDQLEAQIAKVGIMSSPGTSKGLKRKVVSYNQKISYLRGLEEKSSLVREGKDPEVINEESKEVQQGSSEEVAQVEATAPEVTQVQEGAQEATCKETDKASGLKEVAGTPISASGSAKSTEKPKKTADDGKSQSQDDSVHSVGSAGSAGAKKTPRGCAYFLPLSCWPKSPSKTAQMATNDPEAIDPLPPAKGGDDKKAKTLAGTNSKEVSEAGAPVSRKSSESKAPSSSPRLPSPEELAALIASNPDYIKAAKAGLAATEMAAAAKGGGHQI